MLLRSCQQGLAQAGLHQSILLRHTTRSKCRVGSANEGKARDFMTCCFNHLRVLSPKVQAQRLEVQPLPSTYTKPLLGCWLSTPACKSPKKRSGTFSAVAMQSSPQVEVSHEKGASHRAPNLILQDHWFQVPLDYERETSPSLRIFAREVVSAKASPDKLPYLIYLQGGRSKFHSAH